MLYRAKEQLQEILQTRQKKFGKENNQVMGTYHSLAQFYEHCGNYFSELKDFAKAEISYKQAISIMTQVMKWQEKYHPHENYELVQAFEQLGNLYLYVAINYHNKKLYQDVFSQLERSLFYLTEALKKQEAMLGQEEVKNANIARISVNLAVNYEYFVKLHDGLQGNVSTGELKSKTENNKTQDIITNYASVYAKCNKASVYCDYALTLFNNKDLRAEAYFNKVCGLEDGSKVIYTEVSHLQDACLAKAISDTREPLVFDPAFIAHYWLILDYHQHNKPKECDEAIKVFAQKRDEKNALHTKLLQSVNNLIQQTYVVTTTSVPVDAKSEFDTLLQQYQANRNQKYAHEKAVVRLDFATSEEANSLVETLTKRGLFSFDQNAKTNKKLFFAHENNQTKLVLVVNKSPKATKTKKEIKPDELFTIPSC